MKASIGLRTQAASFVFGNSGRFGGIYAQCGSYTAPAAIHCFEQRLLRRGEDFARVGRRHAIIRVLGEDMIDQFALLRFARHDRPPLDRHLPDIEPELGLGST